MWFSTLKLLQEQTVLKAGWHITAPYYQEHKHSWMHNEKDIWNGSWYDLVLLLHHLMAISWGVTFAIKIMILCEQYQKELASLWALVSLPLHQTSSHMLSNHLPGSRQHPLWICFFTLNPLQVFLSTRSGAWVISRISEAGWPVDMAWTTRFYELIEKLLPEGTIYKLMAKKMNRWFNHENYGLIPVKR